MVITIIIFKIKKTIIAKKCIFKFDKTGNYSLFRFVLVAIIELSCEQ